MMVLIQGEEHRGVRVVSITPSGVMLEVYDFADVLVAGGEKRKQVTLQRGTPSAYSHIYYLPCREVMFVERKRGECHVVQKITPVSEGVIIEEFFA